MNYIDIMHKGKLFARIPEGQYFQINVEGRQLHVGPDGMYFIQPIVPADELTLEVFTP